MPGGIPTSDDHDARRIEEAVGGSREALRSLLEAYGPQVWNEMRGKIGPAWRASIDPDDVMQVTYIEAFLQIGRLTARDAGGFVGWLRRIAENNLRDAIKELQRKKRPDPSKRVHAPLSDESYVALVELLGAESETPSRHVAQQEASGIVNAMLDRMPPDYARVIRLYDLEGREIAEVAAAMGRSSGAVHMLRARAHDRLRGLLGAEARFFSES